MRTKFGSEDLKESPPGKRRPTGRGNIKKDLEGIDYECVWDGSTLRGTGSSEGLAFTRY